MSSSVLRMFAVAMLFSLTLLQPLWAAEAVNVNTADAVTIAKSLDGVGKVRAEAIVQYRTEHGDFTAVDELAKVKGIGKTVLEKNHDYILLK